MRHEGCVVQPDQALVDVKTAFLHAPGPATGQYQSCNVGTRDHPPM
jgi:hypothetical protein